MLKFPAEQPVYPMQLTQFAGNPMSLTLFCLGEEMLVHEQLETIYSHRGPHPNYEDADEERELLAYEKYEWPEGIYTTLTGTITPEKMQQDFFLEAESYEPFRKEVITWELFLFKIWIYPIVGLLL